MNTLTKMALGLIGQLKPAPAQGYAVSTLPLPLPQTDRQGSLMQALQLRQSQRDFDTAPLELVFVAHHARMSMVPASQRQSYAWLAAGAMAQNVYLYCAAAGLATVLRAWIDRDGLGRAMGLGDDEQVLVAQTIGLPAMASSA